MALEENRDRTIQFFKAVEEHRRKEAIQFQEYDARYNAAEAFALRCPCGTLTVLKVRDPVELWESSSLLDYEVLDTTEAGRLSQVIESGKWCQL